MRETGQAIDRVGVKTGMLAVTKHDFYDDPVRFEDHLSRHRQLFPLLTAGRPIVHPEVAYIAPCATLIGSVRVGPGSSIWYGAIIRADACENAESFKKTDEQILTEEIENWKLPEKDNRDDSLTGGGVYIGENTNIQDACIITAKADHCRIGNGVTVGHLAQIHSATIEDFCLIGMGSIVQEGATISRETLIAAGTVVPKGQVIGAGELWMGNPARKVRDLRHEERERLHFQSDEYVTVALGHQGIMQLGGNLSESMLLSQGQVDYSQDDSDSMEGGDDRVLEQNNSASLIKDPIPVAASDR
jgi:carbonic anhydrase/acetyltransferase-like protein (isoleucine patch superfamily)